MKTIKAENFNEDDESVDISSVESPSPSPSPDHGGRNKRPSNVSVNTGLMVPPKQINMHMENLESVTNMEGVSASKFFAQETLDLEVTRSHMERTMSLLVDNTSYKLKECVVDGLKAAKRYRSMKKESLEIDDFVSEIEKIHKDDDVKSIRGSVRSKQ